MNLILYGSGDELVHELKKRCPHTPPLPMVQMQMLPYQMMGLYAATWEQCRQGGRILEIGTGFGGSSYMMAKAGPRVEIVSLTVNEKEAKIARNFLDHCGCQNVEIVVQASWDYLAAHPQSEWDMIYVDGDHNRIERDLIWFNQLKPEGLFLCHDYSGGDSFHPSPRVYAALNEMHRRLDRPFDVLLLDDEQTGMAGFQRHEGEVWE